MRAQGAGGQHVNKTESAIRITHVPSGIVVMMQEERSQHRNRAKAMDVLRARLYDMERQRRDSARAADRRSQVGSGDRSERIRTYNFPQARVTDHRVNLTLYKLDKVMEGEAHDIFAEARTFIDAEHTGNTARYRSHRAADGRTNRARRCTTCRCATFGTADDTLCIGCKRERRCKSRRSDQKFESHSHLSSIV